MLTISIGARCAEVLFLQRMLNKRGASPQVAEDLDFGTLTKEAVVAFQRSHSITPPNGTVDARTWNALGLAVETSHNVRLRGQTTDMSCWSAAATMILGNVSVGQGLAHTGPTGGLSQDIDNIDTFLRGLGWSLINNQTAPPASTLIAGLARGPLWLAFEGGSFKHAVVASAIYSDRSDDGTVIRIHDPWPRPSGTLYASTYRDGRIQVKSVSPPRVAVVQYAASAR